MIQEISKRETGNDKLLGMANYSIYFKTKFNLLVIQKQFSLLTKCGYMTLWVYIHITLKLIAREVFSS